MKNEKKNWLEEREKLVKSIAKQRSKSGSKKGETWLDGIPKDGFERNYIYFHTSGYFGRVVACERLYNGNFGLIVKASSTYFNGYINVEYCDFGMIEENGDIDFHAEFLHYVNARNAGRKINGKTYAQSYRDFAITQVNVKYIELQSRKRRDGEVLSQIEIEDYNRQINTINYFADVLERKANDAYQSWLEDQEKQETEMTK